MKSKKKALTPEEKLSQALLPREEWPYELPKGWVWTRLGATSEIIMGQSPSGDSITNDINDIPLIGGASDMGKLYPEVTRYTTAPTKLSKKNDLILCIRATLGRPIYSDGIYCLGRGVAAVRPQILLKEYLKYFIAESEQYLYQYATGTTFLQVNSKTLLNMPIPLPSIHEQQRIVNKIESLFAKLDEAGDRLQKVLDGYEARRAAILHEAFSGKWTGDSGKQSDIKRMPLKKCGVWHGGGTPSKSHPEYWANGSIMWITSKDMKTDVIDNSLICVNEKGIENSSAVYSDKPAVLFVMRSGVLRHSLPIAMVSKPYTVNQDLKALTPEEGILPEYVMWACKAEEKTILNQCMKSGTTVESINFQSLLNFQISVYPEKKQRYIVDRIHKALTSEESSINHISSVYTQIDLMKKSILARAFRGELGTQDSSDPSALELLKECVLAGKEVTQS